MAPPLNRTIAARILRVNHGGEFGAIGIYRSQIALARMRCPELLPFLTETLVHERDHMSAFRALMPSRAAMPCRLMWVWGIGGTALGLITGLLGRRAILVCTEAVERTVHKHLQDQLRYLCLRDAEMAEVLERIQRQELEHLDYAETRRTVDDASAKKLEAIIARLTDGLIWLSTRGDSGRLARELAA